MHFAKHLRKKVHQYSIISFRRYKNKKYPNLFCEDNSTLILKSEKGMRKLQIYLMNLDAKITNKTLTSQIQQCLKRKLMQHDQVKFISLCKLVQH